MFETCFACEWTSGHAAWCQFKTDIGGRPLTAEIAQLKLEKAKLREERNQLWNELNWIGTQFCRYEAEGANEATGDRCTETGACITEYCYPCYAKTVLKYFKGPGIE